MVQRATEGVRDGIFTYALSLLQLTFRRHFVTLTGVTIAATAADDRRWASRWLIGGGETVQCGVCTPVEEMKISRVRGNRRKSRAVLMQLFLLTYSCYEQMALFSPSTTGAICPVG